MIDKHIKVVLSDLRLYRKIIIYLMIENEDIGRISMSLRGDYNTFAAKHLNVKIDKM